MSSSSGRFFSFLTSFAAASNFLSVAAIGRSPVQEAQAYPTAPGAPRSGSQRVDRVLEPLQVRRPGRRPVTQRRVQAAYLAERRGEVGAGGGGALDEGDRSFGGSRREAAPRRRFTTTSCRRAGQSRCGGRKRQARYADAATKNAARLAARPRPSARQSGSSMPRRSSRSNCDCGVEADDALVPEVVDRVPAESRPAATPCLPRAAGPGRARSSPTALISPPWMRSGATAAVGSTRSQPRSSSQTSDHACASDCRTIR